MIVSVDADFARFGGKSYAINKINSVEVRERRPHGIEAAVALALVGLLLGSLALGTTTSIANVPTGTYVLAASFFGLAYWQWLRSKAREYLLILMTSSSEAQAFASRSLNEVHSLRVQIEEAMLTHSRPSSR